MKLLHSRRQFLKTTGAAATVLASPAILRQASAASGELNIMGSDIYVPKPIRDKFTKETGIRVNFRRTTDASQTFNMLAVEGSEKSTDMAIIAGHRLYSYIAVDTLDPIDISRLPGFSNINTLYTEDPSQFVEGERFGVPLLIGFNLLGSRTDSVDPALAESWASIFGDTYAGRVTMRPGSALFAAMFYRDMQDTWLDYDGNAAPVEAALQELREYVISRKHVLRKWYESTSEVQQLLIGNEVDVAQGLNGGIVPLVAQDPAFGRAIPKEGAMGWTMNYSLIKGGRNQENAYRFIDMVLSMPDAAGALVRSTGNISTFVDPTAGLTGEEAAAFSFDDAALSRISWLDVKGADDPRYALLDKYTAGIVEA